MFHRKKNSCGSCCSAQSMLPLAQHQEKHHPIDILVLLSSYCGELLSHLPQTKEEEKTHVYPPHYLCRNHTPHSLPTICLCATKGINGPLISAVFSAETVPQSLWARNLFLMYLLDTIRLKSSSIYLFWAFCFTTFPMMTLWVSTLFLPPFLFFCCLPLSVIYLLTPLF